MKRPRGLGYLIVTLLVLLAVFGFMVAQQVWGRLAST